MIHLRPETRMNPPRAAYTQRTRILIGYTLRERCHVWDSTFLPSANESQSGVALMVIARTDYNGFICPMGWSWPDGPRSAYVRLYVNSQTHFQPGNLIQQTPTYKSFKPHRTQLYALPQAAKTPHPYHTSTEKL